MRGAFLSFDETSGQGQIEADGRHYRFERATLPRSVRVQLGQSVNFIARGDTVTGIWAAASVVARTFTWRWFLFSAKGRIPCRYFWLRYWLPTWLVLALWLLAGKYAGLSIPRSPVADTALAGFALMILWSGVMVEIKRWHDRDKSGWWILLNLIPVVGPFWAFIECGFLDGTEGPNKYGPAPLAQ